MSNWDQFFSRPKVFFMTHSWIFKRFNVEYLENISQMQEGTIKYTPIKYICSKKEGGIKAKVYIYYLYDVILLLKIVQGRKRCLKITKSEPSYFMNGFKYETCKNVLDNFLEMTKELELEYIFNSYIRRARLCNAYSFNLKYWVEIRWYSYDSG